MAKRIQQNTGSAKITEPPPRPKSIRISPELIEAIKPKVRHSPNGTLRYLSDNDISETEAIRLALNDYLELVALNGKLKEEIKEWKNINTRIEKLEAEMCRIKRKLQ